MKKYLKIFLIAFVVAPCMFIFAACGSPGQFSDVKVNVSGNYFESSASDFENFIGSEENNTSFNSISGIKMSYQITIPEISLGENIFRSQTISSVAILKYNDKKQISEIAFKVVSNEGEFEIYAPNDGYIYSSIKTKSLTQKTKVQMKSFKDLLETYKLPEIDDSFLNSTSDDILSNDNVLVKKATEGTKTKYEVSYEEILNGKKVAEKLNAVYENNEFYGLVYEMTNDMNPLISKIKLEMHSYNEKIIYPDFSSFTETLTL